MTDKEPTVAEQVLKNAQTESGADHASSDHETSTVPLIVQDSAGLAARKGFCLTQRLFVLGAICLVFLSVFDTYSNQPEALPPIVQQPFDSLRATIVSTDQMSIRDAIDLFDSRRIFGPPPPMTEEDTQETAVIRGWRAEVREHWNLKGTSEISGVSDELVLEAIVFDSRAQRLQFLRAGAMIRIADREVEVTRVEPDRVELRREDEVFVLD